MSELFPPDPDSREVEPTIELDDLMSSAQWPAFCEAVDDWELTTFGYDRDPPDERLEEMQRRIVNLSDLIGTEYYGKPCDVFGFAYTETDEGADEAKPETLSSKSQSWFMGCDMQYIKTRWRVVFEVVVARDVPRVTVSSDGAMSYDVVHSTYYLRPNSDTPDVDRLVGLRVAAESDDDASDELLSRETVAYVHAMAADASVRIAKPDFATMSAADQRILLGEYLADLEERFPRQLRDREIVVDCTGAYAGYADMPGMNFKEYIDWSDASLQGQGENLRTGEVMSFSYIELEDIPADQVLSAASFAHGGVPYANLRSENSGIIYHVPLTAIRNFM